ncbi:LRR receptor-like serine threonine-protein kinase [Seminavis robusta]|uniref:LRR receptor-like serine threonine-protein kinase n=1 Tax=Seminavis robusta TaxID=568900 RepID=A0A9N8HQ19_9STRA|nr:LRR receptor-like serine threonine-protein kinase [Seminavis robusta]|eukprot:Sro1126_g244030.1 LRR receptor-like serine threonine-protein kinase (736) ;mRNA; r:1974-4243
MDDDKEALGRPREDNKQTATLQSPPTEMKKQEPAGQHPRGAGNCSSRGPGSYSATAVAGSKEIAEETRNLRQQLQNENNVTDPVHAISGAQSIRPPIDLADDSVMPMPPPQNSIAHRQQEQQPGPGAYPVQTVRLPAEFRHDDTHETEDGLQDPNHAPWNITGGIQISPEENASNREGLAVANLVQENSEFLAALPQAQNVDMDSSERRAEETKKFKTRILLSSILVIAVIIILLAALVPPKDTSTGDGSPQEAPRFSPSQAPTTVAEYVMSLITANTTATYLEEAPDSPQSQALKWLLEDSENLPYPADERLIQKFALATVFYATGGANWADHDHWLDHSVNECEWYTNQEFSLATSTSFLYPGFLKDFFPSTEPPPTTCDERGLYQHLWLDANNLQGSLPSELYLLTSLKTISVGWNNLHGSISRHIGHLRSLEGLSMGFGKDSGTIPSEIGFLRDLRMLALNDNNHEGFIPSELWQLTNLEFFTLFGNPQLKGSIPTEIGKFSKLKWIVHFDCDLTGTLPTEIGEATSLEWLALFGNSLTGTIPTELKQLSKIHLIALDGNALQGRIPTELGALESLRLLFSLFGNQLTGWIPSELGRLTNLAIELTLKNNNLTGTIPTELGRLSLLSGMELENNQLSGQICSEFGQLTALRRLLLGNNSLSGTLPLELQARHQSLQTLSVEGNPRLSGSIPEGLCTLSGICKGGPLDPCSGPALFSFDCTSLLCGCDCACG